MSAYTFVSGTESIHFPNGQLRAVVVMYTTEIDAEMYGVSEFHQTGTAEILMKDGVGGTGTIAIMPLTADEMKVLYKEIHGRKARIQFWQHIKSMKV